MARGGAFVIPVAPHEMAERFADRSTCSPDDDDIALGEEVVPKSLHEVFGVSEHRLEMALDRLPPREADYISLYFMADKRQADIARIFGVTQAAVSYRLDRAMQRLQFILGLPEIDPDEMREHLSEVFDQIDVDILMEMFVTTCQSEVAAHLGLTQGRVRHRFFKAIDRLKEIAADDETYSPYSQIFSSIGTGKNFNVLRAVDLPQWRNRGTDGIE